MPALIVQIQPEWLIAFDDRAIDTLCTTSAPEGLILDVLIEVGEDDGRYLNITFSTPSPAKLWPLIRE